MIDHMTFRVRDMARTKAFYAAILAPLGYRPLFEGHFDGSNSSRPALCCTLSH